MNDYIKFLIEEIKKEKTIEYNTGHGDKNSKEVISPISFIEKKEKSVERVLQEDSFKKENTINYSSKVVEKENVIIDSNIGEGDRNNNSFISFDSVYEDKAENELSFEINAAEKEQVEVEHEADEVSKTTSNISVAEQSIEKQESSIITPSSTLNKTEVNVVPNYTEIDKIGKPVESSSLTGAMDYVAGSFGKPYLSISSFAFFDWRNFEENMSKMYDKANYYPVGSAASRIASYADLGSNLAEADLVGVASSLIDIVSFTIGGKRDKINKGRYDLLIKPKYDDLYNVKIRKEILDIGKHIELSKRYEDETGFTFTLSSGEDLDKLIYKNQKDEDDDDPTKVKTVKEKANNFEEERTETEFTFTSDSGEYLDGLIYKNQKDEDDDDPTKVKTVYGNNLEQLIYDDGRENNSILKEDKKVEEKGDFKENKTVNDLKLTSDSGEDLDKLIYKNQKDEDDDDPTKVKTVEEKDDFKENKTENDLTLISGNGEIDPDFKKEKIGSSVNINYDFDFYKIRNSEEYNSIGYIYVSPVNDDAVSGSKFIRIPLQSNLVNNGETLKAEYNTTDFLGRIGSVQQYIRTGSQTFSLETYYHVDANEGYNGYTMKDLQKIEMMYKSLMFPKLKEVKTDGTNIGYSFYTRPPIINIEIGNLNEFKNPNYSDGTLPDLNNLGNSGVINNFFTRVNYSEGTFKVNFKDFIVTDLEITKDYEKTPFYLEKKEYTINDNKISLYSPKDLMGFKVSLTVTEIDPNYFGILPSFDDYAKFATRTPRTQESNIWHSVRED